METTVPRNSHDARHEGGPTQQDDGFRCHHCSQPVLASTSGTHHRNHCPYCLWSLHVDHEPGDRRSPCQGLMEPVAVWVRRKGEWALVHRCEKCGSLHSNRIAGDDNQFALLSIAVRPLAQPPFPLGMEPVIGQA
jgi:Zn finger protein HypA/HybF involved in hydrogenase expression